MDKAASTLQLIEDVRAIVGDRGLLTGGDAHMRSCDPFRDVPMLGPMIVRPAETDELARVIALCATRGQHVVVQDEE